MIVVIRIEYRLCILKFNRNFRN